MRRSLTLLLLLTLAACQDSTGPDGPGPVASVELSPQEAVFTTVGATTQFTARAADADGVRVEDPAVSWRSSNSAVVRVDDTGLATAVTNGTATITAQVESVTGDAPATVCAQPLQISISAGQYAEAPVGCPLLIPSGAPADRYRVAIVRLSAAAEAAAPTATLQMSTRPPATAPPPAAFAALQAPAQAVQLDAAQIAVLEDAAATARTTAAAHDRIRASEELLLRRLGPQPPELPAARARVATPPGGPQAVSAPKRTFQTRSPTTTSCSSGAQTVTGLLIAENADVAIYQDSAQAQTLSRVTTSQARRVLDFYTNYGKPVIQSAFGTPPDRDGNNQIVILVTPEVGGEGGTSTAAFVWGGDLLARSACQTSNEMELVYFNAFMFRKMDTQSDYQAPETLVHEVKHIVSFHQRLTGTVFGIAAGWAEEGAAEIAGEKASRRAWAATGGPAENAMVTMQSFAANGNRFTVENYGVVLRLLNSLRYTGTQPNSVVFASSSAPYSVYGSGWHFHRFLGDAYGMAGSAPNADAQFFLRQTSSATPAGANGLPVLTGKSFAALMVEYAAAVMLNGTGAPAPTRAFTTYNFPSAAGVLGNQSPPGRYPHPVTGTPSSPSVAFAAGSWSGAIGNAGLRIHDFTSSGTVSAEITVTVEQPARVVVTRLR